MPRAHGWVSDASPYSLPLRVLCTPGAELICKVAHQHQILEAHCLRDPPSTSMWKPPVQFIAVYYSTVGTHHTSFIHSPLNGLWVMCVPEIHSFPVGWVFTKNFPEGRLHPPLSISCSLLITTFQGSHLRPAQEPRQKRPVTSPRWSRDWFPTCWWGARPREKEQLPSSCSLQSAVHCREKRVVSVGWTHRLIPTLPRSPRQGPALL